jgi:hypothetical protein
VIAARACGRLLQLRAEGAGPDEVELECGEARPRTGQSLEENTVAFVLLQAGDAERSYGAAPGRSARAETIGAWLYSRANDVDGRLAGTTGAGEEAVVELGDGGDEGGVGKPRLEE